MQRNNNVTFVVGLLLQGGAERVVANLSSAMANQGKNVVILSYYDKDPAYDLHPRVRLIRVQRETRSKNIIKNIIFMRRYFRKRQGVIFSFIAVFNIVSIIAHMGLKSKLIVADRNDPNCIPESLLIRITRNYLYRFADLIVVQTKKNAVYFRKKLKTPIRIIYNPLELNGKEGQALRVAKEDLIVSVGRLMRQKNQKMMIRAFCEVHKKFPTYKLVIFGDGDFREELERLSEELGLLDYVRLPGNCTDIYDKISLARLFVISSDFEGMPNALIEAMGLGLPVISTKVSGATDLIIDGVNGELVDIGDEIQLAKRMAAILCDESLQIKYGRNAIKICDALNNKKIAEKWLKL